MTLSGKYLPTLEEQSADLGDAHRSASPSVSLSLRLRLRCWGSVRNCGRGQQIELNGSLPLSALIQVFSCAKATFSKPRERPLASVVMRVCEWECDLAAGRTCASEAHRMTAWWQPGPEVVCARHAALSPGVQTVTRGRGASCRDHPVVLFPSPGAGLQGRERVGVGSGRKGGFSGGR